MRESAFEVLKNNLSSLRASLRWLSRSYAKCEPIGIKLDYTDAEFDDFENLTSRYARTTDLIINKVLRSIDIIEFLDPGSVIDAANRAEKRGIIESVSGLRELKELRNDIAHEYETEDLHELFSAVLMATPRVIAIAERIQKYCKEHFPELGERPLQ